MRYAAGSDAAGPLGQAARRSARARTPVDAMRAAWDEIVRAPGKDAAFRAWALAEHVHPDVLYTGVLARAGSAAGVTASLLRAAGSAGAAVPVCGSGPAGPHQGGPASGALSRARSAAASRRGPARAAARPAGAGPRGRSGGGIG